MKKIMTKTMKTLAVAGMAMGLALGAQAEDGLKVNGEPLTDLSGTGWSVDTGARQLILDGSEVNRFDLTGQSVGDYQTFRVYVDEGNFTLYADAMIAIPPEHDVDLLRFTIPDAEHPWYDQEIVVDGNGKYWLGAGTWYLNPTDHYDTVKYACEVVKDGVWRLTPPMVEYRAPVYNTEGDPKSGIDHWETLSTNVYKYVTADTAKLSAGCWVVDGTVSRGNITVEGAAHLILKDGCSLKANGAYEYAGITVSGNGNSLAIYGQSASTGKLTANSGGDGAGIGGNNEGNGSNITINGGVVTATGDWGAGIGGGSGGNGSNITINGGTVAATGSSGGAGIGGGGSYCEASGITINGGTVTATGGSDVAGIGGEDRCEVSGIYVNPLLVLKADNNDPPTTVIANTGADLANALKGRQYVTVAPPPPVEITVKSVENATAYTNTVSEATKLTGEVTYTVFSNEIVTVIYKADEGKMFPGGYKTFTTNVTAIAATTTVTLTAEQQPVDAEANPNCLTFSAEEDFGIKMWRKNNPSVNPSLEYSTDQIYWETFNKEDGAAAGPDHKLYLRGSGNNGFANTSTKHNTFTNTFDSVATAIACSGNIETLLDYKTVAAGKHPEMKVAAFGGLFSGFAALTAAPELPATNLVANCYDSMFSGCTSLTAAPKLPATNLAGQCYNSMFSRCTSLTAAPELPATNLAESCYIGMFMGCASLVVNTNAPGKAWSIPAEAKASAASAEEWNMLMFEGTPGNITITKVTPGVTYYVASALVPVTVALPEVEGATAQLLAFDANGGWASVATNEVPSNATVRVVYTAADGKAWENGVYVWSSELVATSAWQQASAPAAPTDWSGSESSVTLAIDTRTTKSYLDAADILPIWYAAGAEVKVEGEGEETLVKNAANTNTLAWVPAAVGVYDFAHTGDLTAQIVYATPVDLSTNGLEVTGTTVAVTADGAPIPEDGRIASNSTVAVTWTVDASSAGKYFMDGSTTYTASFTATGAESFDAAAILADAKQIPEKPAEPKLLLGVVAQRYPWDGKIDVQYWAKNTPNTGYEIIITVTLPDGTPASETHDCKNGKNTVAFDARKAFGEVQIPKGVKVKATLVPVD